MRRERGMVTAETATIAPFVMVVVLLLLWVVSLGITQVRLVDASREAARVLARGESVESVEALARRLAPPGATVELTEDDGTLVVTVTASAGLPVPALGHVGAVDLEATAVAAREEP